MIYDNLMHFPFCIEAISCCLGMASSAGNRSLCETRHICMRFHCHAGTCIAHPSKVGCQRWMSSSTTWQTVLSSSMISQIKAMEMLLVPICNCGSPQLVQHTARQYFKLTLLKASSLIVLEAASFSKHKPTSECVGAELGLADQSYSILLLWPATLPLCQLH